MKHTADKDYNSTDRTQAGNSGFKNFAVQWFNQVLFFNQTLVNVDSFVLRNRHLLKPANRYPVTYIAESKQTNNESKNNFIF